MSDSKESKVSLEQYEKIIHALSPCMDDYLYVYDLVNDVYCISPTAVERFRLPASRFTNVNEHLKELTHPDDWYTLSHDFSKLFCLRAECLAPCAVRTAVFGIGVSADLYIIFHAAFSLFECHGVVIIGIHCEII